MTKYLGVEPPGLPDILPGISLSLSATPVTVTLRHKQMQHHHHHHHHHHYHHHLEDLIIFSKHKLQMTLFPMMGSIFLLNKENPGKALTENI